MYTSTQVNIHPHVRTRTRTHMHICTHARTHARTRTHTHTHTHTITCKRLKQLKQLCFFTVDASESGTGSLEVVINNGSVGSTVSALGSGQYHASFVPQEAKQHVIQLKFNGKALPSKNLFVFVLSKVKLILSHSYFLTSGFSIL